MKRRIILVATTGVAIIAFYLLWRKPDVRVEKPEAPKAPASAVIHPSSVTSYSVRTTNALGDTLTDAQDPEFVNRVFPKFREFVEVLDHLGVNPFQEEIEPALCSKIRIIKIPGGIMCPFVIGDGWTADYTENPTFSGITHFGQRGRDNPYRAISHADMNALRRLSQGAITMPEARVWTIANQVADAFEIDRSNFEKPQMFEEGLFEYRLGIYTVRHRKKGSDPVNQLNYTREFSLKAVSPTTAALVSYSHLEATLR